jgi:hypothetical protein
MASLDLEEKIVDNLFKFTRHVIHGDMKSSTMAEAQVVKWKKLKKNRSFASLQMQIAYANTASVQIT